MCNVNTSTTLLVHNEFFLDKFLHIFNPIVDPSTYKFCVQSLDEEEN